MELAVLLLLLVIPGSLTQEDLEGKMFVFPSETSTAHVVISPVSAEPSKKVSVCLNSFSEILHEHSLFSLTTRDYSDAILIKFHPLTSYTININSAKTVINTDTEPLDWRHTCVTWDSDTGVLQLWVNGKLYPGGVLAQHSSIGLKTCLAFVERKKLFSNIFYSFQSLVEISDVHMWNDVLTSEDIQKVISGNLHGNIINWKSLRYEMSGDVFVKPKLQHLERKMFFFPKETNSAHVVVRPFSVRKPMSKVSVCLRYYSDLSRPYAVFSLATPGNYNAFLIYLQPPNTCLVHLNQEVPSFTTNSASSDWRHLCVTWDSDSGVVHLWENGILNSGKGSTKGPPLTAETSIVLGQDQDSFGGGYDTSQSFVGEISDVHMWDHVLTSEDVQKVISGDLHGNLLNWMSLDYEIKGEVFVKPKVCHMESKMFVFPKEPNAAHVLIRPAITQPLSSASFCLRAYSKLSHTSSLFFSPIPNRNFQIIFEPPNTYTLILNERKYYFRVNSLSGWRHICVTLKTGLGWSGFWVDGKPYEGTYFISDDILTEMIPAETIIVLGQGQDFANKMFDSSRSFVGEMSDVHMWDYDLKEEDIQKVISGDLHGNVINWKSLRCEIKGDVLIKPRTQHLENKALVFPKETNSAYGILRPSLTKSLQKVSVCLRSYTELSRPYSLFSLATPGKDNAFLIFLQPPNTCSVYINQEATNFRTDSESLDWRHICVSWDSDTGVVQLWVNGKLYPRKTSMKGSSIAEATSIILGQEQDNFGGGFESSQSFVGEISDVHMWDYALTSEDVQNVISGVLDGNIINWLSLLYEVKGEVLVLPK